MIDYDRVVFSSAFRRLQDKTQVFPLSESDYTRTRLTHSLEVASVGRTLARRAFKTLKEQNIDAGVSEMELSAVVSTACLAHDIGNPPLGHSGETAIGAWAKNKLPELKEKGLDDDQQATDLLKFEGNAQGFRVLTRLQMRDRLGGICPTGAMVGALAKYPRPSVLTGRVKNKGIVAEKKFGFFQQDEALYRSIYEHMNFVADDSGAYRRHPLAFLTEAADDICYGIIDLEDAHKLGIVSYEKARDLLNALVLVPLPQLEKAHTSPDERISRLRAGAISKLIDEASKRFAEELPALERGELHDGLVDGCPSFTPYENINQHMRTYGYTDPRVLTIEVAGFQTLGGLLDIFSGVLLAESPGGLDKKVRMLFPKDLIRQPGSDAEKPFDDMLAPLSVYDRLLAVTDFVSGMTDSFAVDLYQRLSGIKIGR
ncbi:MAG: dNTP triphosphohydrolase [Deltaproteobacteria bacterium]|nr:dNTP triphosphohydrolase [Deltaproteobacteria bacterium]